MCVGWVGVVQPPFTHSLQPEQLPFFSVLHIGIGSNCLKKRASRLSESLKITFDDHRSWVIIYNLSPTRGHFEIGKETY